MCLRVRARRVLGAPTMWKTGTRSALHPMTPASAAAAPTLKVVLRMAAP